MPKVSESSCEETVVSKKPRILMIMPSTHPDKTLELLLNSQKIDFELIAIKSKSDFLCDEARRRHIKLTALKVKHSGLSIMLNYLKVRKIVRRSQPNLIESHTLIPGILSSLLRIESKIFSSKSPKIIHFRHHNLNHHLKKNRLWVIIDKIIFNVHDLIVVPSRQTQSVLIAEGCKEEKIRVIPHKINLDRISGNTEESRIRGEFSTIRIIAVGRIDWQKDYELLLDSISHLLKTYSNFEVKIFGDGSQKQTQNLAETIKIRSLNSFVELCGWSPDIEYEMSKSDIFLHTSRDESYGLVLAEALLLGVPIVSTWAGGASDLIAFHDRLPCSPNPDSLGNELSWVIENLTQAKESAVARGNHFFKHMNSYDLIDAHLSLLGVMSEELLSGFDEFQ